MEKNFDHVLPFQLEESAIRGRLVRLDQEMWKIIEQHNYPTVVNNYLAQATALSIALVNCFKFDGLFTLQISGSGPLRLLVVDIHNQHEVRACARFDEEKIKGLTSEAAKNIQQVFGQGTMVFTIDPEAGEDRYQGVVELSGTTLSESTHHFFRQSEQLETGVVLANGTSVDTLAAAALMIQRLPVPQNITPEDRETLDDQWIHALSITGSATRQELLDRNLSNEDLLYRLFWEGGVRVYGSKFIIAQCRCSTEKIKDMLTNFSSQDRHEMVFEDKITVTCEFCGIGYKFSEDELEGKPA
ncbi:MAG: Hsp33 family molecular chaperone HslO [Candidatus Paracaedibacteraceae bacterium]|nr:Hsp33 family molecular chaperone HslO [Candidatus Paracaedibacteraceae bacterium]